MSRALNRCQPRQSLFPALTTDDPPEVVPPQPGGELPMDRKRGQILEVDYDPIVNVEGASPGQHLGFRRKQTPSAEGQG